MKKIIAIIFFAFSFILGGCAKGEITLDISRLGSADVTCKLVAAPILQQGLETFKKDFMQDGFDITETTDGNMEGFTAHKFYLKVSDIKDSKVLETFKFSGVKGDVLKGEDITVDKSSENEETKKPLLTIGQGLLFDQVTVDTRLDLAPKQSLGKNQEQWIMENIMKQVDLRFILKLPTKAGKNNATTVSDEGKTLTWILPLGEDTSMQATVSYLNPYKAAAWGGILIIIVIAGVFIMAWKKRNKQRETNKNF